jgi:hypothetical protein
MDVQLQNHGTIWLAFLKTAVAREWVDEHTPEDRLWYGPLCLVIGSRYVGDIAQGMAADGLQIEEI